MTKVTVLILTILSVITPIAPVFAQESKTPIVSELAGKASQGTRKNVPEPKKDTPTEAVLENVKPVEDPASVAEQEKPKEEKPTEKDPQALSQTAGTQDIGLKFQIPTQSPVANVDKSTGSLSYEYPIELPKGRNGMTPELSLKYNSRNVSKPDSYAGLGWELSIPYIQREPIRGTQDLYFKAFFSSSLSGSLIATTDTSSSQYTIYRPETDGGDYLKYTYNSDNTWTMTGKDGRTYTFGGSSASRQDNPSDATKVYKWMVSKIADAHGNEIQYSYTKDSGQIYPSQILYTYHSSSPAVNTVALTYTTPTNYGSTVYNAAFPITTLKLLSTITITTSDSTGMSTNTYNFSYTNAQFLKQRLLSNLSWSGNFIATEFPQPLNSTTFSYSTKTPGWEQGTHSLQGLMPNDYKVIKGTYTADFDANGYPDLLISGFLPDDSYYAKLVLNSGTSFTDATSSWSLPATPHHAGIEFGIMDLNGDHLPDLHPRLNNQYTTVYINTGSGFTPDTSGTWRVANYIPETADCGVNTGDYLTYRINAFLYDINNDGKNDILYFGGSSDFRVFLNNGSGWTQSTAYTFTTPPGANFTITSVCSGPPQSLYYQTLLDINGDGLADYISQQRGTYLNTGSGFAYSAAYSLDITEMNRSGIADINGDGLVDYVSYAEYQSGTRCIRVFINNGAGFTLVNPAVFPPCTNSNVWYPASLDYTSNHSETWGTLIDVTADGYPDIIGSHSGGSTVGKVRAINDASKAWISNPNTSDPWTNTSAVTPLYGVYFDINSDGVLDFVTTETKWGSTIMPASKTYMGKAAVPNMLTQITTSLGAQTVVTYDTSPTNHDDTNIAPTTVVKKMTVQNLGQGQPSMVTQYAYTGGAYISDPATGQKRFAGFQKVTATESGTDLIAVRVTDTYFHQANGSDLASNEATDTSLALIGRPYYTVVKNPAGTLKKEMWNKYGTFTLATDPLTSRVAKFAYTTETVVKTTDPDQTVGTAEIYTYDTTLGERTELRSLGFVAADFDGSYTDISGDTHYQFTEYANNSGSTIVKAMRVDIRTSSSSSDTVARTDYYYDSQALGTIGSYGDVTKESKWVSGNGSTVADTTYTYDLFGNVLTETNPRSATTTYTYDATKSRVASETNHLNHITTYEYTTGKITKLTDPNGRVTTYGYSNLGWLYRTTSQNTGGSQMERQSLELNTPTVPIIREEKQNQVGDEVNLQTIDGLGRPVRRIKLKTNYTSGGGTDYYIKFAASYDALGRQTMTSAPYGTPNTNYINLAGVTIPSNLITTTTYDIFDRPTSVANALGMTSISYAGTETTTTDANSKQKKTKTDAYGNLVEVKEYNGGSTYTTSYTYDIRNLLTGITDTLGNVRAFTYNNAGWLTNSQDLHASADASFGSYSFTYDLNGNKLVETQPNGVTVTRIYDMLDRPTSIDGSSTAATDYTLTYDSCTNAKGRLCTVSGTLPDNITLSKAYVYGISEVPTSTSITTLGSTYTTSYLYNRSDQIAKITYPNNTIVRYAFGDWAKPDKVYITIPGGSETTYATVAYHHTEQLNTITVTNGPTITNTYDDAKLYRKTNTTATMGGTTLQSYNYTYDNVNNIIQIIEPNLTKTYTYDDLNRLTQAVHTPSGGQATTYTYSYNAIGNITSANGSSYTYSGTGKTNPHAVTSIGSNNYTYDDNGNIATSPNQVFIFNWQNQPTKITLGGSTNIGSYYDENGQRFIYQTQSSTEVQVDDTYLVRGGTPEISLKLSDVPIGTISNGMLYSSIADHLGTPVKQINSSGTVVEAVTYGPFGAILSQTGTLNTKHGYTGHEYDVDTGLTYAEARYYNAAIGKFISQDPAFWDLSRLQIQLTDPQSWNSYSYARNNPIKYNDPDGQFWDTVVDVGLTTWDGARYIKSFADATAGAITTGIGELTNNQRLTNIGDTQLSQGVQGMKNAGGDLAWDAAGTAVPFVPVAGVKVVKNADNIVKLSPSQIGKQGEKILGDLVGPGEVHKMFDTSQGKRFVDRFTGKAIHEVKNGYVTATQFVQKQIKKDAEIIKNNPGIESTWHLLKGGSESVKNKIKSWGSKVIDYTKRKK